MVERICGTPKDNFLKVAQMIGETSAKDKTMTSMYALGWTQHSKGSQNIRAMAMLQLILGNIGVRGGGMNALRGHSNIQGLTDLGLMSNLIPGYLTIPTEKETSLDVYMSTRGFKPLRPNQMSYWQNYKKFFVSFQKSMWGDAATADNSFAYDYLPKLDVPAYDVLRAFELMFQGKMNGYFCQGFNPLLSFPNRTKLTAALSKLKFLVVMDPLQTETARFWENHGEYNDVDTASIQTEVIELPTTCFAEDEGSLTNSGRWLQWHWAGGTPPGEAKHDAWIMAQLYLRLKALYQKEGGAYPDPMIKLVWPYKDPGDPKPDEMRQDERLRARRCSRSERRHQDVLQKGKQVVSFAALRDDGTTACGCWIYSGSLQRGGQQHGPPRQHRSGRYRGVPDLVVVMAGQPPHPLQSFVGGHRRQSMGSDPQAVVVGRRQVDRLRRAGHRADGQAGRGRALHHEPGRHRAAVHPGADARRAVPGALRAVRIADRQSGGRRRFAAIPSPACSRATWSSSATPRSSPTRRPPTDSPSTSTSGPNTQINASLQPEFFVEISEQLAAEKAIKNGGWVRVWSKRGSIKAKVYVTKRIAPLTCDGKTVHIVGIPLHWGFMGAAKKGFGPNSLTPYVGDANIETPEYKAFLVDIEPITGPVA